MTRQFTTYKNEEGFVLIASLMILVILSILGIMATRTTMVELTISGNDKVNKQTFYQADGGTEFAQQLVFENAICTTTKNGFDETSAGSNRAHLGNTIIVENLKFAEEDITPFTVSDTSREFAYFPGIDIPDPLAATVTPFNSQPHTNFITRSVVSVNPGSGLQMVSGYEGLGAGAAGGGTSKLYTIVSQHFGLINSQSTITVRWRLDNFLISSAALQDCIY